MSRGLNQMRNLGQLERTGRLAVVVAVTTAAAMVPAVALASGGGRAAAAGHPARAGVAAGVISTLAGGVGGPGAARQVSLPDTCGLAVAAGNLYVGDRGSVRKISSTGFLTTPAGIGVAGALGDGGPAVRASVGACGAAVDHAGNLVIADSGGRVRVVAARTGTFYGQAMTAANIYTVAGGGTASPGDGGPATAAVLGPLDVRVDGAGNLVIADTFDNRIRVVAARTGTFYGQAMTAQHIYTVAGNGNINFSGDGGPATNATVYGPAGVALDAAGNLVIADTNNDRIRVVAVSTGTFYGQAMTKGDIYTVAGNGQFGFSGDGGPATSARLAGTGGPALDHTGNLVIADTGNNRIRVVAVSTGTFYGQAMIAGDIYTVAGKGGQRFTGDGGPATAAQLNEPGAVKVDGAGNLVIGDGHNFRVRVVAARTGTLYGQAMIAGDIYTVAGNGASLDSGDHGPASHAQMDSPQAVAEDGVGNLVIADRYSNRIRVVAARTGTLYGQAMTAGDIYAVAGIIGKAGFSGDGGPGTNAKLGFPAGVAVDGPGNVVIADAENSRIRVVAGSTGTFYGQAMTAGDIYTVAGTGDRGFSGDGGPAISARLDFPEGAGTDHAGNLVIADSGTSRIRVVAVTTGTFYGQAMTAGDIYTVAGGGTADPGDGGPATQATLDTPSAVTVDHAGNVVISDTGPGHNRVRVVAVKTGTFYGQAMTKGDIYTVAGGGGFGGDGGPATNARLSDPSQVAADAAGNLVIADAGSQRIRVVAVKTGTFYGQAMTAGHIYTLAGIRGTFGFSGDGGPATKAELFIPGGVALNKTGGLVIADTGNHRIRAISG